MIFCVCRSLNAVGHLSSVIGLVCCFSTVLGGCGRGKLSADELLSSARMHLANDQIGEARVQGEMALSLSISDSQKADIQAVIDEAKARQDFLDRRVEQLLFQSQQAFSKGNVDLARALAVRASQIEMATNRENASALLTKYKNLEISEISSETPDAIHVSPGSRASSNLSWADVVAIARNGVVVIASEHDVGIGTGTGFVLEGGLVVTNHHVIVSDSSSNSMASRVLVKDAYGVTSFSPGILYLDASTDIAVIKLGHDWDDVHSLKLATADLRQGDEVAAIGHPKGFEFTFSMGYVSAIRQSDSISTKLDGTWVQHSAPISRGNSGGPLLNRSAEVIAMNSWYHNDGMDQNLNFAISSFDIRNAVLRVDAQQLSPFRSSTQSISERELISAIEKLISP